MRSFFIALQFLTRIPVRLNGLPSDQEIGRSLIYYPIVGLLIGGVLTLLLWCLADVPTLISAVLLLTVWVLLSGGLHLDGLADSADAWAGGLGNRERTLAIMKDPNCGPAGVVSLVLVLLIKFSALHVAIESGNWVVLLLAPLLGRTALPLLFLTTPYVREQGLGTALANHLPRPHLVAVITVVLVSLILLPGSNALWLVVVMLSVFTLLRTLMMARLGGTTGDLAGALLEITEASILLTSAVLLLTL